MSVTIHQTPQDYTPSDNPVVWTFSSNQTGQANFAYAVKVFINDTQVATELLFPESGIYTRFDASGYAMNYCNTPELPTTLYGDAANYCTVRITVTERYGSPVADGASSAATNITCWKARMFDDEWTAFDPANYTVDGVTAVPFLTNFPFASEYPKIKTTNESIYLMTINDGNDIVNFRVTLFNSGGAFTSATVATVSSSANKLTIFNLSPAVIIAATSLTSANFEAASYYTVSSTNYLTSYRIDINEDEQYSTYKRLHFLSQWGTIESLSFGLISRKGGTVQTFGYRKSFGEWNGSAYEFSNDQGRDITYATTIDREMRCVSDWLSEAVQNWLIYNCHASPLIYEEDPVNSLMIRRGIKGQTINQKIQENDMIFLEEVNIILPRHNSMIV